jgi:predicted nucleic acid-binding protein
MPSTSARASFLDASTLVKLHIREDGSDVVRAYFESEPLKYTTHFCFYEALSRLKGLWKKGRKVGEAHTKLTKEEYFDACSRLFSWHQAMSKRIDDLDFLSIHTFLEARKIAKKGDLDLSDTFQILSVKSGYFSVSGGDSQTVFVTADKGLAKAARTEGLRVWYCVSEPPP